jgi:hypothetical protein
VARRLGIPEAAEQAETVTVLLDELRRHGRWLLIFDNAEHPQDLRPYWPGGGRGNVLVTSRNPAWAGWTASVEVDVLPGPIRWRSCAAGSAATSPPSTGSPRRWVTCRWRWSGRRVPRRDRHRGRRLP